MDTVFISMVLGGMLAFLLLCLSTIFVVLKLDDHISWNWYAVLCPLWATILATGLSLAILLTIFEELWDQFKNLVFLFTCTPLFLTFSVLLAFKLQLQDDFIHWAWIFTPFWLGLLFMHYAVDANVSKQFRWTMRGDMSGDGDDVKEVANFVTQCIVAVGIFTILLVLKLSGVIDWTWGIIFIPLWYIPAFLFLQSISSAFHWLQEFSDESLWWLNGIILLGLLPIIAFVLVLVIRLEDVIHAQWSLVFIPVWFVEMVLMCVACCACWFVICD